MWFIINSKKSDSVSINVFVNNIEMHVYSFNAKGKNHFFNESNFIESKSPEKVKPAMKFAAQIIIMYFNKMEKIFIVSES